MARAILIVLDSVGCGGAEDAAAYGDAGADTLGLIAQACAEGRGHPAAIYTYREGGKLRCMHVRPEFVPELKQAIENGRALEAALVRLGREAVLRSRGREP